MFIRSKHIFVYLMNETTTNSLSAFMFSLALEIHYIKNQKLCEPNCSYKH